MGSLFQEYEKCEKYKRTLKKDKASTSPLRNFIILQFLISNTTEPTCFRKSFSQIFISCSLANCPSPLLLSLCFYFLLLLLYSSLSLLPPPISIQLDPICLSKFHYINHSPLLFSSMPNHNFSSNIECTLISKLVQS